VRVRVTSGRPVADRKIALFLSIASSKTIIDLHLYPAAGTSGTSGTDLFMLQSMGVRRWQHPDSYVESQHVPAVVQDQSPGPPRTSRRIRLRMTNSSGYSMMRRTRGILLRCGDGSSRGDRSAGCQFGSASAECGDVAAALFVTAVAECPTPKAAPEIGQCIDLPTQDGSLTAMPTAKR
jgi:hypothetical protein